MEGKDLQSAMDQLGAAMRDYAPVLGAFYRTLMDQPGIDPATAERLTMQWQQVFWKEVLNKNGQ